MTRCRARARAAATGKSRRVVLIYGATGFSGRLIVEQACAAADNNMLIVLGGRSENALRELAAKHPGTESRPFALDDKPTVQQALRGVTVVLNAAGPFASTAEPLVEGCLESGCHYVDINGEVDVYQRIRDRRLIAAQRGVVLVCGAGHSGAASDLMVAAALETLQQGGIVDRASRLGTIRICLSRVASASSGSMATTMRMLQANVVIGRNVVDGQEGDEGRRFELRTEPVGRLERTFDFFADRGTVDDKRPLSGVTSHRRRRASAASLVDTLIIQATLETQGRCAGRIESYLEMSTWQRAGYQIGSWVAPLGILSGARSWLEPAARFVADTPTQGQRNVERHAVVLEIDSELGESLVRWQLNTPNVYTLTAQLAVAIAFALARLRASAAGWQTPSETLRNLAGGSAVAAIGSLHDCQLHRREGPLVRH